MYDLVLDFQQLNSYNNKEIMFSRYLGTYINLTAKSSFEFIMYSLAFRMLYSLLKFENKYLIIFLLKVKPFIFLAR